MKTWFLHQTASVPKIPHSIWQDRRACLWFTVGLLRVLFKWTHTGVTSFRFCLVYFHLLFQVLSLYLMEFHRNAIGVKGENGNSKNPTTKRNIACTATRWRSSFRSMRMHVCYASTMHGCWKLNRLFYNLLHRGTSSRELGSFFPVWKKIQTSKTARQLLTPRCLLSMLICCWPPPRGNERETAVSTAAYPV